jgi:ABC-type nickel/cobalt efflux system permease component RcnA
MAGPHENLEHAEHAQHAAHEGGRDNKKIALIISVLALFLAFSETFGKSAQTAALNAQIEASNLWNFFQAKNIRRTLTIVASESAKIDLATAPDETRKALIAKQIEQWDKTAARYRSEPEAGGGKGEGTQELSRRAQEMEKARDLELNKYHNFEFASAAFQIGIVLCSAAVITGIVALAWGALGVGLLGVLFMTTGFVMPTFPHDVLHYAEGFFGGGGGGHH